jgi:ribosomal-protein-alanine N-acetyltransferase
MVFTRRIIPDCNEREARMLSTDRLTLRPLDDDDAAALLGLLLANRAFLEPWNPRSAPGYFTLEGVLADIRDKRRQQEADAVYSLGIFERVGGALLGRITLSRITRGPFQNAGLGYWLDERHNGRGLMSEAVGAVLTYAFGPLGLHRVEAATLLHNHGSQRVLMKNGFVRIGVSLRYLQIDGCWQDHVLFAVTSD